MHTRHRIKTVATLAVLATTGFVGQVAAENASTALPVAKDKLTHPEQTIRLARTNLRTCIDTDTMTWPEN
jgi:hypothetical protein